MHTHNTRLSIVHYSKTARYNIASYIAAMGLNSSCILEYNLLINSVYKDKITHISWLIINSGFLCSRLLLRILSCININ